MYTELWLEQFTNVKMNYRYLFRIYIKHLFLQEAKTIRIGLVYHVGTCSFEKKNKKTTNCF